MRTRTRTHRPPSRRLWLGAAALAAALALAPVQAAPPEPEQDTARPLVWPPPPQQARIRFIKTVAGLEDIEQKKGFLRRLWEFIRGTEEVRMLKPMALVVDSRSRLVVADPAAKSLHIFDQAKGRYQRLQGSDREPFELPIALALDAKDTLYLADGGLRQVLALDFEGTLLRRYGADGSLKRPTAVAVDEQRARLYVIDTPSHDIKVFDLPSAKLLKVYGSRGTAPGRFNYPSHLSLDGAGRLYVTDALNARIQVLDPEGRPLQHFGQQGDGSGDFDAPKGNAVDSDGHLYVADAAFDVVQIFNRTGELLLYFGSRGQGPAEFWMPSGLYIDRRDRIYVADSYNQRVQVFQYLKEEGNGRH